MPYPSSQLVHRVAVSERDVIAANGYLTRRYDGVVVPGLFMAHYIFSIENNALAVPLAMPVAVYATADIKVTCISDSASASATVTATLQGWLEAN